MVVERASPSARSGFGRKFSGARPGGTETEQTPPAAGPTGSCRKPVQARPGSPGRPRTAARRFAARNATARRRMRLERAVAAIGRPFSRCGERAGGGAAKLVNPSTESAANAAGKHTIAGAGLLNLRLAEPRDGSGLDVARAILPDFSRPSRSACSVGGGERRAWQARRHGTVHTTRK